MVMGIIGPGGRGRRVMSRHQAIGVDFAAVALACGYRAAAACDDLAGFGTALAQALAGPGPHLIHLRIQPGSLAKLGRPTVKPSEVARRFRDFLTAGAPAP